MGFEDDADRPDLKKLFFSNTHQGKLGKIGDQTFYTIRYEAGKPIAFPFKKAPFSALLNIVSTVSKEHIEQIAKELLNQGLACAICNGEQAEEVSNIIDDTIDKFGSSDDQHTPYSSPCEEGIDEALQYFALPTGITNISLIITIGTDNDHGNTIETINNLSNAGVEYEMTEDLDAFEDLFEVDIAARYFEYVEVDENKYLTPIYLKEQVIQN